LVQPRVGENGARAAALFALLHGRRLQKEASVFRIPAREVEKWPAVIRRWHELQAILERDDDGVGPVGDLETARFAGINAAVAHAGGYGLARAGFGCRDGAGAGEPACGRGAALIVSNRSWRCRNYYDIVTFSMECETRAASGPLIRSAPGF
jgi:hypothetical protein